MSGRAQASGERCPKDRLSREQGHDNPLGMLTGAFQTFTIASENRPFRTLTGTGSLSRIKYELAEITGHPY